MKGDFAADGEVKPLWDLLMGGRAAAFPGKVHALGTLGGTLADPQARGEATIAAGQFSDLGHRAEANRSHARRRAQPERHRRQPVSADRTAREVRSADRAGISLERGRRQQLPPSISPFPA